MIKTPVAKVLHKRRYLDLYNLLMSSITSFLPFILLSASENIWKILVRISNGFKVLGGLDAEK